MTLEYVVPAGLAAGALASLVRVLVPRDWRKRKPWGCNACLGTWSALAVVTVTDPLAWDFLLKWMAVAGLSMVVLAIAAPVEVFLDDLPERKLP